MIYGGGHSEMRMAQEIDDLAKTEKGKESIAISAFANALRQLPIILADNGGKYIILKSSRLRFC